MSFILSLETSTDVCSVALFQDHTLLHSEEIHQQQAHASRLAPLIQAILQKVDLTASQLSAVAISSGPGSYTGLRIGTSTAKGLCFALNIPLVAVPTLQVLAAQARPGIQVNSLLCPMIDARRMEVYCQLFDMMLNPINAVEPRIIDEHSFQELLESHKVFFFGNGADKCKAILRHANVSFLDNIFPTAEMVGKLAYEKWSHKEFEDLTNFTPYYLKEFNAKKGQALI
jgi:tRNA threonylcarbamoyladenosine biosynthesis protein TsaB